VAALELADVPPEQSRPGLQVDDVDRAIIDALVADGRTPFEAIASLAGFSQATARRRIDLLLQRGLVRIRAVVDPALLGLPIEALLWIRCAPQHAQHIGTELARSPLVRYAAMVMGEHPVVVDVTARDIAELRDFLTDGPWAAPVESVHSTLLLQTFKRGGVITESTTTAIRA
jgi:DNA-binding Lrp family transcriptional regulator